MKYLSLFIVALSLAFSAGAASPDYKAFRGIGGMTVTTNPPTGTVVVDGISKTNFQRGQITNELVLGGQGTSGSLYAYETVANANRRVLIMSPSGYILGTNDVPIISLSPITAPSLSATQLNLTGTGPGIARLFDAAGTEYFQLEGANNIQSNSVLRVPTNALPGVMVAQPTDTGTNQWQFIPLTTGQYVTYNGTAYVASNLPSAGGGSQTPWTSDINGDGFALTNVLKLGLGTAADPGTQNSSVVFRGTNSSGQPILFRMRNTNAQFRLDTSINGAAYSGSSGNVLMPTLSVSGTMDASGYITAGAATGFFMLGRAGIQSSVDGAIELFNNGVNNFNRLSFGGTTAAFPSIGRTNGHLKVFGGTGLFGSASTNAMYIDGGTYYVSNTIIPSVTQLLGAGGYWVGNSNGFLVTVYTLDGSTTAMKVLAP